MSSPTQRKEARKKSKIEAIKLHRSYLCKALRSGIYTQAFGTLVGYPDDVNIVTYCTLGVAYHIHPKTEKLTEFPSFTEMRMYYGLTYKQCQLLTTRNDVARSTFEEQAQWLERLHIDAKFEE